ncbi:MAG: 3-dehydroquinate synthase [Chthoniobacterales bacterium]
MLISVNTANGNYPVHIESGLLDSAGKIIAAAIPAKRIGVITDENVHALYGKRLEKSLRDAGITPHEIIIPAGEKSKSFASLEQICDALISAGLDRSSGVIALGGGVVGDVAGFAAAVYFRGIPLVQIPTSIVAQVDSAIGGKTAINSRLGKNLIGAFHQPSVVIADPALLQSLPDRERNEGFAEIIKHSIIRDAEMLNSLRCSSPTEWEALIARNVKIKADIVSADVFEKTGERALLNFGHTIGHGIEQAAGYGKLLHGEAISMGILAACRLSEKHAGFSSKGTAQVVEALKSFNLPIQLPADISSESILDALKRDKKFSECQIRFVLTRALGSAFVSSDITQVDIVEAIAQLRN